MLVLVICGSLILSVTCHGGHQHSPYLPEISENKAKSFLHNRHIGSLDPNASPHPKYCTYLHPGYEYWCEQHIPYCQGQQEFTREHRCATLSTPCSPGQHCVLTSHCPAHFRHNCVDLNECNSNPCQNGGTCHNGNNQYTCTCLPGWTGTNCEIDINECDSNPCKNGGTCHNGNNKYRCSCLPGWKGTNCKIECTGEWYGVNCSQRCVGHCRDSTTCNHVTGHCDDGCDVGFKGLKCDKECYNGTFGYDCISSCSGHCLNNTPCNKQTGHCDKGCKPGYINDDCSKECLPGYFGVDCRESCSGHCINDESCNHISGHCSSGCQDGYFGEMCNKSCKEKYYGKECSFICSQNCKTCRHTDGFCTCFAGYTGFGCNEACYQSYGENCQFPCSQHCRNKNCSIFNGTCLYGCTEGFYGEKCDKDIPYKHDASISTTWMIGFSISFAINVILIILVLACLWGIYTKKVSFPRITTESVYCENTVTKTDETSNYQELKIKEDMAYQNSKENNAYVDLTLQ